jgi:hypothetical protein
MKTRLLALALFVTAPLVLKPAASAADEPMKPYPLKVCIVTDNDLGSMGDEKVIVYEGREIKFCCAPCERKFRRTPAKYLEKLPPGPQP